MPLKTQLMDLLARARDLEREFVAGLTDAERSAAGTLDDWSAKDTIAHLAAWHEHLAHILEEAANGVTPTFGDDIDLINAEIYEKNRRRSWDDTLEYARTSRDRMMKQLQQFDEQALRDPTWYPWLGGRPLWKRFLGNGYHHVLMHLAPSWAKGGERERVVQMYQEAAALLDPLDDSPSWHGLNRYNIACGYALAGLTEKAILTLGQALELNPELVAWSKDDPDLDSLRQEPGYQALYLD